LTIWLRREFVRNLADTAGQGIGTVLSEQIEELTAEYAFFFDQLGVKTP
jgi:hypothetical protein